MKAIIRIRGLVGVSKNIAEALHRIRLRRKYSCVVLKDSKQLEGVLKKIRNFVAYGDINDKTLKKLVEKRGRLNPENNGKKLDAKKVVEELKKNGKSKVIKPFFRLHPPRKGIKSKIHYPKGVLGNHGEEINKLIEKML